MTWTAKPPSAPGVYWLREYGDITVVEVDQGRRVWMTALEYSRPIEDFSADECEWWDEPLFPPCYYHFRVHLLELRRTSANESQNTDTQVAG